MKTAGAASGHRSKTGNSYKAFSNIIKGVLQNNSRTANQFVLTEEPVNAKHFIGDLIKHIMARGINASAVVLDDSATSSLKKLLLNAGFKQADVSEMMDKMKNKHLENKVSLQDLISGLDALNSLNNEEDVMADISVLPHLESMFKLFGMDNDTIEQILSASTVEGAGIAIDRLVRELENKGYTDKHMLRQSKIEERISDMMTQINITDEEDSGGKVSLQAFVEKLKSIVAKKHGRQTADAALSQEAKTFIDQLQFDEGTDKDKIFLDKINKINAFNPAAKLLSDDQKAFSITDSLVQKPEVSVSVSAVYNEMEHLSKINGKVNIADLLDNNPSQDPGRNRVIKTSKTNLSYSKNDNFWSEWNGNSAGMGRMASAPSGKLPASKPLPSYMLNQVSRQIVKSIENGDKEIRLQLKPPHLGRLQITLETVNDALKVNIVAEQHATRDMLIANSSDLKTVLFDQGIRLEKVEVQLAFNFDQSMGNAKHEFRKSKDNNARNFSISDDTPGVNTASGQITGSESKTRERLLDLVA